MATDSSDVPDEMAGLVDNLELGLTIRQPPQPVQANVRYPGLWTPSQQSSQNLRYACAWNPPQLPQANSRFSNCWSRGPPQQTVQTFSVDPYFHFRGQLPLQFQANSVDPRFQFRGPTIQPVQANSINSCLWTRSTIPRAPVQMNPISGFVHGQVLPDIGTYQEQTYISPSAAAGTSRAVTEAYECILCADTFDRPKLFPCGHTFCGPSRQCITNLMNMQNPKCPVCQADIGHLAIEQLTTNYTVMAMIEEMKNAPKSFDFTLICSECDALVIDNSDWTKNHNGHDVQPVNFNEKMNKLWGEMQRILSTIPDHASKIDELKVIQDRLTNLSENLKRKQKALRYTSKYYGETSGFSQTLKNDEDMIQIEKKEVF